MKNLYCLAQIFLLSLQISWAQNLSKNQPPPFAIAPLATFDWQSANALPYHQELSDNYSFSTYQVLDKNRIAFLTSVENQIWVFDLPSSKWSSRLDLPVAAKDFTFFNQKFYVLGDNQVVLLDPISGAVLRTVAYSMDGMNELVPASRIRAVGKRVWLESNEAAGYLLEQSGKILENAPRSEGWEITPNVFAQAILQDDEKTFQLKLSNAAGKITSEKIYSTDRAIGSAMIVGGDANQIFLEIHEIAAAEPMRSQVKILAIEKQNSQLGNVVRQVLAPTVRFTQIDRPTQFSSANGLTFAVSSPQNVQIFQVKKEMSPGGTVGFPNDLMEIDYDYSDHTLQSDEPENLSNGDDLKRMALPACCTWVPFIYAVVYANHNWTCSSANYAYCYGVTPAFTTSGNKVGIAYKWGGATENTNIYNSNIGAGKRAGDTKSAPNDGVFGCATGVDCSGFIGLAWGIPNAQNHPYGTTGPNGGFLSNTSIATTINWNNRGFGDVAVKSGHIRLITSKNANGSTTTCEATPPKVIFKDYNSMPGYISRRRNVPFVVCNKPAGNRSEQIFDKLAKISVAPNPAAAAITISMDGFGEGEAQIAIFDGMGRQLKNSLQNLPDGDTRQVRIEIEDLPNGLFFVRVSQNGLTRTAPFSVLK